MLLPSLASAQITGQGFQVQNHGAFLGHAGTLNCGTNLTCLLVGGIVTLNASGGGGGTVTGSGTTGVLPIWTNGPGSVLGDSVFQQSSSAIIPKGFTSIGGIGFNTSHYAEIVADGATLANDGQVDTTNSILMLHQATRNQWSLGMWNDLDGKSNAALMYVSGAYPANQINFTFGDGAGASKQVITFLGDGSIVSGPDVVNTTATYQFNGTSLIFGTTGSSVTGAHSVLLNVGTATYGLSLSDAFVVVRSAAGQQSDNMIFAQANNQTEILNFETTNNAVGGIFTVCAADAAGTCGGSQTRGVASFDAQDATNIVTLAVQSNPNAVKLINNQTSAGSPTEFQFWTPNGAHSYVSFKAPDTTASDLGVKMTLPSAYPATSGFPLVSTTAGVLSFSALANSALTNSSVTLNGTSNQINTTSASVSLGGSATLSLSSTLVAPGSLTVTTRSGTPATMAVFTSGGVLAETTLPSSGTVTSIATTSPITGGTITTTGTIACATCVTAASALTSGHLVAGAGGQATAITDLTGDATTSGGVATTVGKVNGVTYPASPSTNTVPVVTGTNTITYEAVPNAALANSSVTVNGTTCTLGSSCTPASTATTVISWSNAPIPADWGAQLLTMSSTLTVRYAQYVQIPYAITVNQITVAFGPVTTPGTFKECVYSADGSSKLIDITVTPVAASLVSGAVSAVTIGPGSFWFVIGGATTNSGVQIRSATTEAGVSSFGTAARPSGKTVWHGTVSHTSGTCNTTLGTVTASGDVIPNFFFDN